jgi:predicted ATP-grasp superfamily ATP-dependent carboligase
MGILAGLSRGLGQAGARLLGSSVEAVDLAADKAALADHLSALGVDTPPCSIFNPREGPPPGATYPAVVKPIDGAGTIDTFYVDRPDRLQDAARNMPRAIWQPFVAGTPMSANFLVDSRGRAWPLATGRQHVILAEGRFIYRGGRLPVPILADDRPIRHAVESVPGLRGFVGVDFVRDDRGRATVLEINPRPTTSIVGLLHVLPPGRLASAWLRAVGDDPAAERLLTELAQFPRLRMPIAWDEKGTILEQGDPC